MPTSLEIAKNAIDDFVEIQGFMVTAREEHATETYKQLKGKYIKLKAILNIAGVNLAELDQIKE